MRNILRHIVIPVWLAIGPASLSAGYPVKIVQSEKPVLAYLNGWKIKFDNIYQPTVAEANLPGQTHDPDMQIAQK